MTKDERDFIAEEEEESSWKDKDNELHSPDEESEDDDLDDHVDTYVEDVEEMD